jgi:hypothetical protein
MISLNPREYFTIFRGLSDHTDVTTYYVQAVIKNIRTGDVIETVNLTDLGDRQFKKDWQVPADTSGNGFWIGIVTSVYSDAGYTTKATTYLDEYETYLVFDRKNPYLGGGGGGSEIDYKKIDKMIKNHIDNIQFPIIPEQREPDLTGVYNSLEFIKNQILDIHIPKPEKLDLSKVMAGIEQIKQAIDEIEMPEIPETDLSPMISGHEMGKEDVKNHMTKHSEEIKKEIAEAIADLSENVKIIRDNSQFIEDSRKVGQLGDIKSKKEEKKINPKRPYLSL